MAKFWNPTGFTRTYNAQVAHTLTASDAATLTLKVTEQVGHAIADLLSCLCQQLSYAQRLSGIGLQASRGQHSAAFAAGLPPTRRPGSHARKQHR